MNGKNEPKTPKNALIVSPDAGKKLSLPKMTDHQFVNQLTGILGERNAEILFRRSKREPLRSIGNDYGLSYEAIRLIAARGKAVIERVPQLGQELNRRIAESKPLTKATVSAARVYLRKYCREHRAEALDYYEICTRFGLPVDPSLRGLSEKQSLERLHQEFKVLGSGNFLICRLCHKTVGINECYGKTESSKRAMRACGQCSRSRMNQYLGNLENYKRQRHTSQEYYWANRQKVLRKSRLSRIRSWLGIQKKVDRRPSGAKLRELELAASSRER